MFDRFTYKQKNYGLLLLLILLAMVSYKRSFLLTINLSDEIDKQEIKKVEIKNSDEKKILLQKTINAINQNLGKTNIPPDKVEQSLLNKISVKSQLYNISLVSIKPTHVYESIDYKIITNEMVLTGDYAGMIKTINQLENDFDLARVINTKIYLKQDYGEDKNKLYAKILFQHYFKN